MSPDRAHPRTRYMIQERARNILRALIFDTMPGAACVMWTAHAVDIEALRAVEGSIEDYVVRSMGHVL